MVNLLSTRTSRSLSASCSPAGPPQACTDAWGCSVSQVQDPALAFVEPLQVPLCPACFIHEVLLTGYLWKRGKQT